MLQAKKMYGEIDFDAHVKMLMPAHAQTHHTLLLLANTPTTSVLVH